MVSSLMFLNYEIDMNEQYGSLDQKYQYWVQGHGASTIPGVCHTAHPALGRMEKEASTG
ncbi:MAG TPA: hypothetical protein PK955_03435 [Methanoregulaceae archaeon]|nr:hypothetical protein [Methanoregulaceae archaeon]